MVYKNQPQGTERAKQEKQTDLGSHRVQFMGRLTDRSVVVDIQQAGLHAYNPSSQRTEAGGSWIRGQSGIYSETLSQNNNNNNY
jgi:hypothetical protein